MHILQRFSVYGARLVDADAKGKMLPILAVPPTPFISKLLEQLGRPINVGRQDRTIGIDFIKWQGYACVNK